MPAAEPPAAVGSTPAIAPRTAAFARQIAVLAGHGMPLGGRGEGGIRGDVARRVSARLAGGATLDAAFAPERRADAAVLRAALTAADRSGRPAEVLAVLGDEARLRRALRRDLGVAAVYPLLVVLAAAGLAVSLLPIAAAAIGAVHAGTAGPGGEPARPWDAAALAGAAAAVLCVLGGGWWWLARGPAAGAAGGGADLRRSRFASHLSLLLGRGVPLPDALVSAADAAGAGPLADRCRRAAGRLETGGPPGAVFGAEAGWPPLLRWALRSANTPAALREAAVVYRRRAARAAGRTRLVLPVLVTVLVGGGAVLAYGLALVVPLRNLLHALTVPR